MKSIQSARASAAGFSIGRQKHSRPRSFRRDLSVIVLSCLLPAVFGISRATAQGENGIQVHQYSGALTQKIPGTPTAVIREFELLLLNGPELGTVFVLLDDETDGCPWPESIGRIQPTPPAGSPSPHLMYNYLDTTYTISLPMMIVELPDSPSAGDEWVGRDGQAFQLLQQDKDSGSWKVRVREQRGRVQSLSIDATSGRVLSATADVFMGRGDRFELTLESNGTEQLSAEKGAATGNVLLGLLDIQEKLKRQSDSTDRTLSDRQLAIIQETFPGLKTAGDQTPLLELLIRIHNDVRQQVKRSSAFTEIRKRQIGSAAPSFTLTLLDGSRLSSADLTGHVTILHFWDYRNEPLAEPYGQVGYLDFLLNKSKNHDIRVIGVASNSAIDDPASRIAAVRSARKLVEFMNLSYPIAFDDGSLLRSLGDPRETDGELPLWVVLDQAGTIREFRNGFYEVEPRTGLKELNVMITELLDDTP